MKNPWRENLQELRSGLQSNLTLKKRVDRRSIASNLRAKRKTDRQQRNAREALKRESRKRALQKKMKALLLLPWRSLLPKDNHLPRQWLQSHLQLRTLQNKSNWISLRMLKQRSHSWTKTFSLRRNLLLQWKSLQTWTNPMKKFDMQRGETEFWVPDPKRRNILMTLLHFNWWGRASESSQCQIWKLQVLGRVNISKIRSQMSKKRSIQKSAQLHLTERRRRMNRSRSSKILTRAWETLNSSFLLRFRALEREECST